MMATDGGGQAGMGRSCGPERRHIPVLLDQVLDKLVPKDGAVFVDATFGAGGYANAILNAARCQLIGLDRDPLAIEIGRQLEQTSQGRLKLIQCRFGELAKQPEILAVAPVDGVVLDIGVSSMQLDQADRGFSFLRDGPLDMRMSAASGDGPDASQLVNELGQSDLADIIFHYGEERRSRAVAAAIVRARGLRRITRTRELAAICEKVCASRSRGNLHPATRTFQALRIAVNDELGELVRGLACAEQILKPGGRLVVVTFHSLEDRIVKRFLALRSKAGQGSSRHLPFEPKLLSPSFQIINQRPLVPSNEESKSNPRSRSAKLRWAVRTASPLHPLDESELGLPSVTI
ncbi:MAG: 16S rRNA (cytosine(1402)-N(4))-methyltransferase RsmH [Hyphomicrobiaceae bacterium]